MHAFKFNEKYLSQIPALQELIALGYAYLSPERALALRGGKNSNVLLESVLREQLQKFNRIQYKGIDDFFYDEVKSKFDMILSAEQMDEIIEKTMQIAKSRRR